MSSRYFQIPGLNGARDPKLKQEASEKQSRAFSSLTKQKLEGGRRRDELEIDWALQPSLPVSLMSHQAIGLGKGGKVLSGGIEHRLQPPHCDFLKIHNI